MRTETSVSSSSGSPTTSSATRPASRSVNFSATASLYQHPLDRHARLPGVGEPGGGDRLGRRLPVAVGLDDHRRVVAQLEDHLLAPGLVLDRPADLARTGEGEVGDVGMAYEGVAHLGAAASDDVEVVGRQPAVVDQQPDQGQRRQRRLAGRLEHDRAPGGDGGGQLVGHQVEREVERRDGADHPDRHPQGEGHPALADLGGVDRNHVAGEPAGFDGGEGERADRPLGLRPRRLQGLGRLGGDGAGEVLRAIGEQAGGGVEDLGPPPRRERSCLVGGEGGGDRLVDVGGRAPRHLPDLAAVVGRAHDDRHPQIR